MVISPGRNLYALLNMIWYIDFTKLWHKKNSTICLILFTIILADSSPSLTKITGTKVLTTMHSLNQLIRWWISLIYIDLKQPWNCLWFWNALLNWKIFQYRADASQYFFFEKVLRNLRSHYFNEIPKSIHFLTSILLKLTPSKETRESILVWLIF